MLEKKKEGWNNVSLKDVRNYVLHKRLLRCAMCGSELTGDREKRIGLCESCICAEEMPECILGECQC